MVSASRGPSAPLGVLVLLATATVAAVVILPSIPAAHAASGPSTVGVTTSSNGLGFAADDYVCGANGRFWVFYYNGVNWGWQSSTDGQTWSSFTSFTTAVPGPAGGTNNMAFYCSGATDTVYYAGGEQDTDAHFYFNSGTLNADGSITWGTEAAVSTEGYNVKYPSITQDSAGDVWVAVQSQNTGGGGPYYIEVYEMVSSIWGQSLALSFSGYLPIPQLVAFSDGDIALLYGTNSIAVGLETYAGSWTAGPSTTATNYNALLSTAVAVGTNIEYCASTGSSIYLLSYAFGGSWSTPSSSFASGDACSAATDGSAVLGLFYASATTITYDQSNNGGSTFAAPQTLSTAESGVTVVGAGLAESSNPAKQVMAVWLSGSASPYSVRFVNVSTAPVVNEEITISETNGGPVASATVSGCHATVTSIPMDGASHTFGADPSCSLTISVPTDGSFSRYRFPGTSTTWTFTTGSTSPDVHTTSVYYQYLITAYYTVAGGSGAPPAPTLTSTETGLPIAPTLSTTASPYWLDAGASWSVPASLTSGGTTWTTAPSSGTVSSPDTFDFVYSPPVTVTSTVVSVSVSVTTTTVFLAGSAVPSASSLTCAQVQAQVNHRIVCT